MITAQGLLHEIAGLDRQVDYSYVNRSNTNRIKIIDVQDQPDGSVRFERVSNSGTRTQGSIAHTRFITVAQALSTRRPVQFDALFQGGGNERSVFEALLAYLPHIFVCYPDGRNGRKCLIWRPDETHQTGTMSEPIMPDELNTILATVFPDMPFNKIYFGAPGTGKSHKLQEDSSIFVRENIVRITFYPTYSFSQFVGAYKPIMVGDTIRYSYVPGPFIRSWVKAMLNPEQKHLLIIEELNRANAPAVFGDVFQLMDRLADGMSEYPISISDDLRTYLSKAGLEQDTLAIPPNLYIWATMNSADQGVFPLDTAFKRRWDFEYMSINANEDILSDVSIRLGADERRYSWNVFRREINKKLIDLKVNEDKLLGPFFIKPSVFAAGDDAFSATFKAKVIMYLFEDAARQVRSRMFPIEDVTTYSEICKKFDKIGAGVFGITLSPIAEVAEESTTQEQ